MDTTSLNRLLSIVAVALFASAEAQLCPDPWVQFETSCYLFMDEVVPWTSAKAFCDMMHSTLLVVETKAENDFITAQIQNRSDISSVWTGLNDLAEEGRWRLANNYRTKPSYFNWKVGQPDNSPAGIENGQDCVSILADGSWDDLWCETFAEYPMIQYKPSPVCEAYIFDGHEPIIG